MNTAYAIKTEILNSTAREWDFPRQKTMYGGKYVAVGDTIFVFASENEGGWACWPEVSLLLQVQ